MNVLAIIVASSLAFIALSLAVSVATFAVTLVENARGRRSARNEAALIQSVSGYLGDAIDFETLLADLYTRTPADVVVVLDKVAALVSGSAHNALAPVLNHPGVKAALLAELGRSHPQSQILAARLLADVPDPQVIAALHHQLRASNPLSRLAAALALVRLDAIGSTRDLIDRLDIDTEAQSYGLIILFRELLKRNVFELVELLHTDVPAFIKTLGIDALGNSGNYNALQSLMMFAENESDVLRLHALKALNKLKHPGALPAVEAGLADLSPAVRAEAAVCAGALQLPQTRPGLEHLLEDPDWTVRFSAAEALIAIGEDGRAALAGLANRVTPGGLMARQILAEHEAA